MAGCRTARSDEQLSSPELGALAGGQAENNLRPHPQPASQVTPSNPPTILANLLNRLQARRHAMDKLKANEFIIGD